MDKIGYIKKTVAVTLVSLLTLGMTLNFSGCSDNSPMAPTINEEQNVDAPSLAKSMNNGKAYGKQKKYNKVNSYPQFAEQKMVFDEENQAYKGGTMKTDNGSIFHVFNYSLTPPEGTVDGESVLLTMKVELEGEGKNAKMIFSFGPSGSRFSPSGYIRMAYRDMSGKNPPKFYYIKENGEYIEQKPLRIERKNKFIYAKIDHFSRYALAHNE